MKKRKYFSPLCASSFAEEADLLCISMDTSDRELDSLEDASGDWILI